MDTTALIYTRVSKDRQEREGMSLPAQTRECRRYVREQGWMLGKEYTDTLTGRRPDRPGYQAILAEARRLRRGGQPVAIVVAALDRLGRKLAEQIRTRDEMAGLGISTHFVRQGGELDDLHANILGAVAQDESKRIGDRVRDARRHASESGFPRAGRAAWGYRWVPASDHERAHGSARSVLTVDPTTADFAREAVARVAGGASARQVARWVRSLPSEARGGRTLGYANVLAMLRSPLYIARPARPLTTAPTDVLARPVGHWPALVSDDVWLRVQEQIALHQRMPKQARGDYMLTGLLRCPNDGRRMQGRHHTSGMLYSCSLPGVGCWFGGRADLIDGAVLAEVAALLGALVDDAAMCARLRVAWARLQKPEQYGADRRRQRTLERIIARARKRQDDALGLLVDGVIDREKYDRFAVGEQAEIDAAERELAEMHGTDAAPVLPSLDEMLQEAGSWQSVLDGVNIASKREVLAALVERVVPVRVGRGTYEARIAWTPLGEALGRLRDGLAA